MALIQQTGNNKPITDGFLKTPSAISPTPQVVEDQSGVASNLQISTERVRVVNTTPETCPLEVETNIAGAGISFKDATTISHDRVGVGAFGDLLCLRGGANLLGTMQLGNDFADVRGNELRNFVPVTLSSGVLTINSSNQDSYNACVLEVTGAVNITINNSVREGFNISIVQVDANQCTFVATGGLTLRNRQGHTKTAGQWATTSLVKLGTNLILAGDTA
jgi:hypothetical protein